MAEPAAKRQKVTPRNSDAARDADLPKATPHADLRKLAGVIRKPTTPGYRTPGLLTTSASRLNARTPVTQNRTPRPNTVARPQSARRGQPTTPHAIHALQQRQRAATPGHGRRRSGIQKRETPRDLLRELSRKLAPVSQPIEPSPQIAQRTPKSIRVFEDVDEGPNSAPPRLSIPLDEDDDSWHLAPPRLSALPSGDKENYTIQSVEKGRDKRLSRNSLDSIHASELFGNLHKDNGNGSADEEDEDGPSIALDEVTKHTLADGENTQEFRALIDASRRQSRPSGLAIESSPGVSVQDETFQFRFAERPRNSTAPATFDEHSTIAFGDGDNNDGDDSDEGGQPTLDEDLDAYQRDEPQQDVIDSMIDEASALLDSAFDVAPQLTLRQDSMCGDLLPAPLVSAAKLAPRQRRALKVSRHGVDYPSLPLPVIKRLATTFARSSGALSAKANLGKDALLEIEMATDWFFEQLSDDLGAYAQHAGRKQIKEDDVVDVMKRQRVLDERNTVFSLAQRLLPRELVQEIRLPTSKKAKATRKGTKKRKAMETIEEEEDSTIIG